MNEVMRERISALVDGQMEQAEAVKLLDSVTRDGEMARVWERYHLIGDVLRREHVELLGAELRHRVHEDLAREPSSLRPSRETRRRLPKLRPMSIGGLALAASVAIAAVLVLRPQGSMVAPFPAQLAGVSQKADAGVRWDIGHPAVEARLNNYLVTHSEHAGDGVQGMLHFARIVSYDAGR